MTIIFIRIERKRTREKCLDLDPSVCRERNKFIMIRY